MRKLFVTALILFACGTIAHACINHYFYGVDKEGRLHSFGMRDDVGYQHFNTGFYNTGIRYEMQGLLEKLIVERSYMALSDYAICLLQGGKKEEALKILAALFAKYPYEYQLASNLGTAYELNGQNDSALKYIKRGMILNPKEHYGSEWVHVKILEAKLKLAKDPDYLATHRVLGLTEAQLKDSVVAEQIELQLKERFPFCPAPDPIMAQLIIDLADVTTNTGALELAHGYYETGIYHFGDTSEAAMSKLTACKELLKKYRHVKGASSDERIETASYKLLINDIGNANAEMDWEGLPSDPVALLNYVDLSMSVQEAYSKLSESMGVTIEPPHYEAPVEAPAAIEIPPHEKPADASGGIWFVLAALLPAVVYAVILRR